MKGHVYRIDVTYPPQPHRSCAPYPMDEDGSELHNDSDTWKNHCREFGWNPEGTPKFPAERRFFSKKSAERRAAIYRSLGAEATVVQSKPIAWEPAGGETTGHA